jgi:hypothetical protein
MKRKYQETDDFRGCPESALGTGVRIISFNNLQIDHLFKQQVVGVFNPGRRTLLRITLLKREETLATESTTAPHSIGASEEDPGIRSDGLLERQRALHRDGLDHFADANTVSFRYRGE